MDDAPKEVGKLPRRQKRRDRRYERRQVSRRDQQAAGVREQEVERRGDRDCGARLRSIGVRNRAVIATTAAVSNPKTVAAVWPCRRDRNDRASPQRVPDADSSMSRKPVSCGVTPSRRRVATSRGEDSKSRTLPASALRRPSAISSAVVLPAPLGPSSATISFRCTAKENDCNARILPYDLAMLSKARIVSTAYRASFNRPCSCVTWAANAPRPRFVRRYRVRGRRLTKLFSSST